MTKFDRITSDPAILGGQLLSATDGDVVHVGDIGLSRATYQ
jgi:hypothetical protein